MKIQPFIHVLCTLLELLLLSNFTTSFDDSAFFDEYPLVYTYNRFPEVQKECASFLSSATELKPDDNRGSRLKQELSFFNGDWEQEIGDSPLIPYDDSDMSSESTSPISPLKLIDFEVKDVNPIHQSKNTVSVHATMRIGQARNSSLIFDAYHNFYMSPGMSVLKVFFEGIYLENEGERIVCMLGNTTLPFWNGVDDQNPSDRIRKVSSLSNQQLRLLPDDHILLVLRYPKTFNLTRRSIQGEMRSLNVGGSIRYFDSVHISSQLSQRSQYKFSSGELKSRTCDPFPYQDDLVEDGVNMFNGSEFCKNLKQVLHEGLHVEPNWKFIGKHDFRNGIGPFQLGEEYKDLEWSYDRLRLSMQNLMCEWGETAEIKHNDARVSAVFRAFPSEMDRSIPSMRTGLSGMTLFAEGTWDSSTGQLCMVGCPGIVNSGLEGCNSQISMYFPRLFSIKKRNIVSGSISSTVNEKNSYFPIMFGVSIRPALLHYNYPRYSMSFLSYNYSKTELAYAFQARNQPSKVMTAIKKSLLTYPALQDTEQHLARLDSLARTLYIDAYSVPYPPEHGHKPEIFVRIEVSSLGPLFGHYSEWLYSDNVPVSAQPEVPKSAILNVSLDLMFTEAALKWSGKLYKNISGLFLEGLYDPLVGEMYLSGCRKVTDESSNTEMERGMDCLIEVNILYPPKTFRWLKNPTVKIAITSKRNEDDPLHFRTIRLQTLMIHYDKYEEDAVFRKVFDEILRALLLLLANGIILHQLVHIEKNVNVVPYISLTMLAFQAVGYILPLITHSRILFQPKDLTTKLNNFYGKEQFLHVLDYSGKLLLLACLILTAQISQKVSESRSTANARFPCKPKRLTHERKVVFIMLATLIFGFLISLLIHGKLDTYTVGSELEELADFVQNFFLLPQIIGNLLWQTRVKSLRKSYYFGFTFIRLVALLYGYTRDPTVDPYSLEAEHISLTASSSSKIVRVITLVTMMLLALGVHVQQNLSQRKLCSS